MKTSRIAAGALLGLLVVQTMPNFAFAQHYYTEGTRWTELRLDTTKYDSWFTETYVDGVLTWVPNYEKTEYYVKGDTVDIHEKPQNYVKVWRHCAGQPDSLRFLLADSVKDGKWKLYVRAYYNRNSMGSRPLKSIDTYVSDWASGSEIRTHGVYQAIIMSGSTALVGTIKEIRQGTFGTDVPLTYMELGKGWEGREHVLIYGIGVTSWENRDCILGPCMGWYAEYSENEMHPENPARNLDCRSILVHFERGGETIYDLWPTPEGGLASHVQGVMAGYSRDGQAVYDLQGRKVEGKPSRGIYIIGGKKRVVR